MQNLFDFSGQHAAFNAQNGGDVDVFPADGVQPLGDALNGGQK